MTDEVSQPDSTAATGSGQAGSPQAVSPPEPTPTPQAAPPVAAGSVPAPEPVAPDATVPPAVEVPPVTAVPAEVVNQISDPIREPTASNGAGVVTEAVQDLITPEKPVTPEGTPQMQNSEVSPPKSAAPAPPPPPVPPAPHQSAGSHMRAVVQSRKQARLEKIMEIATHKRVIVNVDVREALKVSDPTATNYLRELVRAGRLKRNGVRAGTRYEPA